MEPRRLAASRPGPYCYRFRPGGSRETADGRWTRGCAPVPGRELIERVRQALGDRYTVITAVGRGGNASIFRAHDRSGHQVAIKVLHPELAVSVAADRVLREIRYAAQLDHPHIAQLLDSGQTDYLLWFVMPYVPGETLRQLLRRGGRRPARPTAPGGGGGAGAPGPAPPHRTPPPGTQTRQH